MAYIVNEGGRAVVNKGAQMSALARADLDRVLDCYRLALMGNDQSRRMWNDFEREAPDTARLVVEWDAAQKSERAEANALADGVLVKAESGGPGKTARRSKREFKAKRAAQQPQPMQPQPPKTTMRDMFKADLRDPDPVRRLVAERALRAAR
jgi:hypothetical protein